MTIPQSIGNAGFFLQDQLNSFLGLSASIGSNGSPRNAMVFTSTLRQAIRAANFVPRPGVTGGSPSPSSGASQVPPTTFQGNSILTPPDPGKFFGNTQAIQKQIAMAVNPKSVRFRQPKRFSKRDVMNGSRFMHFTNSKGQNNDILTIDFRGNTGNIDRTGSVDPNAPPGTPPAAGNGAFAKIAAWHNLYLLTREPMLLDNGQENIFTISYVSPLIPVVVDFEGFFSQVLEFEESGEKMNSRDYSMAFTVTATVPDLDQLLNDVQQVLASFQANPAATAQIFGTIPDNVQVPSGNSLRNL